jgi:protein-S-isoprenylcysteine O-methyltransferase Ste14
LFVFATAHLPALYLARWTAENRYLPLRAALLAVGYGCLAFVVLPSAIMHAMGGTWSLLDRAAPLLIAGGVLGALCCVLGLSAVQMFVLHGRGTPIPLDPTQQLVRSGIFAYIRNPMQLCTALVWIVEGIVLTNIWVASAALMAWVFVAGMVRWHHRYDLLVRFPEEWPEYAAHVPEWRPRWRPWIRDGATLQYDAHNAWHAASVGWLQRASPIGLDLIVVRRGALIYSEGPERPCFSGVAALATALSHTNFALAMIGAATLLAILPVAHVIARLACPPNAGKFDRAG